MVACIGRQVGLRHFLFPLCRRLELPATGTEPCRRTRVRTPLAAIAPEGGRAATGAGERISASSKPRPHAWLSTEGLSEAAGTCEEAIAGPLGSSANLIASPLGSAAAGIVVASVSVAVSMTEIASAAGIAT